MDELIYQIEVSTVLLVDLNPSIAYPRFAESALNFLVSRFPYTWYEIVAETRIADAAHACGQISSSGISLIVYQS